jgi:hypothetical protein
MLFKCLCVCVCVCTRALMHTCTWCWNCFG